MERQGGHVHDGTGPSQRSGFPGFVYAADDKAEAREGTPSPAFTATAYPSSARHEPTPVDPLAAGGRGVARAQRQPLPPPPTARRKPTEHDGAEDVAIGDVINEVKLKMQRKVIYEEVKVQAENDGARGSSPSSHVCRSVSRTKCVGYALAVIAPKRNSNGRGTKSQEGSVSAGGDNPGNQRPVQDGMDRVQEVKGVKRVKEVRWVDGAKSSEGLVMGVEQQGGGGANLGTDAGRRRNWGGEGFPAFAPE